MEEVAPNCMMRARIGARLEDYPEKCPEDCGLGRSNVTLKTDTITGLVDVVILQPSGDKKCPLYRGLIVDKPKAPEEPIHERTFKVE